MQGMLAVKGTILIQLKLFLNISPVFFGGVIFSFTFGTLESDKLHRGLFSRHIKPLTRLKPENITISF
jgi:hypothetical protein